MSNLIRVVLILTTLAAHLGAAIGWAQGPYVYPQRGQPPEQQQRNREDCHVWASQQSGFDPTRQVAQAPPPPPPTGPQGQVLRGAARGAAVGAATGTLFGAMRRRDDTMHARTGPRDSSASVHEVFTKKTPSDHDSGRHGSYVPL